MSGSTGTIELDDALAGSGVVAGPGNAVALSEADDTISAASALRLVAGASNVEHGDIPAAEAVLTLSGVAPLIEQGDALFVLSQGTFLTPAGRTIGLSASRRQSRTIRPGASQLLQRTLSS